VIRESYTKPEELAGIVALSINASISQFNAVGWVRGDKAASVETYQELERLRAEVKSGKNEPLLTNAEVQLLKDTFYKSKKEPFKSLTCAEFLNQYIKLIASRETEVSLVLEVYEGLKLSMKSSYELLYKFRNTLVALDVISLSVPRPGKNGLPRYQEWSLTEKGNKVLRQIALGERPLDLKTPRPNSKPAKDSPKLNERDS